MAQIDEARAARRSDALLRWFLGPNAPARIAQNDKGAPDFSMSEYVAAPHLLTESMLNLTEEGEEIPAGTLLVTMDTDNEISTYMSADVHRYCVCERMFTPDDDCTGARFHFTDDLEEALDLASDLDRWWDGVNVAFILDLDTETSLGLLFRVQLSGKDLKIVPGQS